MNLVWRPSNNVREDMGVTNIGCGVVMDAKKAKSCAALENQHKKHGDKEDIPRTEKADRAEKSEKNASL